MLGLPIASLIAVGMVVAAAVLTRRTALGMLIEAVGINPEASRLAALVQALGPTTQSPDVTPD